MDDSALHQPAMWYKWSLTSSTVTQQASPAAKRGISRISTSCLGWGVDPHMAIWLDFYRSSGAKAAAVPDAPVNERTGQEWERSGGGEGEGMTGGRGVSSSLQHRRLFVPCNTPTDPTLVSNSQLLIHTS